MYMDLLEISLSPQLAQGCGYHRPVFPSGHAFVFHVVMDHVM